MSVELALWMFPALMLMIFMGFPVAFSLLAVAFVFAAIRFNYSLPAVNVFAQKIDEVASAYVLGAVPLFVFMGALLERSGIAERLFEAIHLWTRRLPGGLAVGTVILCVIFAAASGVVGATESVVGLLAIPVMLRYAYDKGLISGTICAGGSLGTIIPPSVVLVVLADQLGISVGKLFVGALIPGVMLAGLYAVYVAGIAIARPRAMPALPAEERNITASQLARRVAFVLVPPLALILFVTFGGLLASCGLRRVRRTFAVGLLGSDTDVEERELLRDVCQRGHRLSYVAGGLQVLLGAIQVFTGAADPAQVSAGLAYTMVGLVQAAVIADLGFGTLSSWIMGRGPQPTAG